MIKRGALVVAALITSLIATFVVRETLFFDSENPYGAKEISPAFRDSIPAGGPSRIEGFTAPPNHPLPEDEARRAVLEFASHRLGLDRDDINGAQIADVFNQDGSRIFVIASRGGAVLAKVQMDRLGRLSLLVGEVPVR